MANNSSGPYNYTYIFKYIIIGDMGVGKSCLLHQFTEKKCNFFVNNILFLLIINFFLKLWLIVRIQSVSNLELELSKYRIKK